jgi:DNA-binding NtrC family response regulator
MAWGGRAGRQSGTGSRVIAASETRLDGPTLRGSLRADLADTLSIYPIEVPPLRDRVEDIPLLGESVFLRLSVASRRVWRLSSAAATVLQHRVYPGNVRELAYVVERAAFAATGEELQPDDCSQGTLPGESACVEAGSPGQGPAIN